MIPIHKDLDLLFGGGLQPKNINHVYGTAGSGKTNLALLATVNALGKGKVVYIDSEGGFSLERLRQIAGEKTEDVLRNMILIEPTDFDEQKVAINKLAEIVPASSAALVIIDSLAVLYRLEEERDVNELGRQLAKLLRIARKYNLPVLATNQVYTDIDTGRTVPVGGDLIRYWAKISIELEKKESHRVAVLRKHKFLPDNLRMEFRITDKGIEALNMDVLGPEKSGL